MLTTIVQSIKDKGAFPKSVMRHRINKVNTISNSIKSTQNGFYSLKAQDCSIISNASLINYKKKLQSQISTIKAVDIFDTSTRYTILADPSIVMSSDNVEKSPPQSYNKSTSVHGEYHCKFGQKTQISLKSRQQIKSGILELIKY